MINPDLNLINLGSCSLHISQGSSISEENTQMQNTNLPLTKRGSHQTTLKSFRHLNSCFREQVLGPVAVLLHLDKVGGKR